jgi:hypothetical protein
MPQSNSVERVGKVKIPVFAIVEAIPRAIKRAREVGSDDRDADSPGGSKVTVLEVTECVAAFFAALTEEVLPKILSANDL